VGEGLDTAQEVVVKYAVSQKVIILEENPEDGFSIGIVRRIGGFNRTWQQQCYEVEIIKSTHYGPDSIGDIYYGLPEMRLRPLFNETVAPGCSETDLGRG
jgi:hypothetical protein